MLHLILWMVTKMIQTVTQSGSFHSHRFCTFKNMEHGGLNCYMCLCYDWIGAIEHESNLPYRKLQSSNGEIHLVSVYGTAGGNNRLEFCCQACCLLRFFFKSDTLSPNVNNPLRNYTIIIRTRSFPFVQNVHFLNYRVHKFYEINRDDFMDGERSENQRRLWSIVGM